MKGELTVREVAQWLLSLPDEFQDAPYLGQVGSCPVPLKRIVAYRDKDDPSSIGVCANPMGTHLPFDDSLTWVHVLGSPNDLPPFFTVITTQPAAPAPPALPPETPG